MKSKMIKSIFCGIAFCGIVTLCGNTVHAKTKSTVVTVTKADEKTAKSVDKVLKKQKGIVFKVKGNKKNSKALLEKLQKKVAMVNEYGVLFSGGSDEYGCRNKINYKGMKYKKSGKYGLYTLDKNQTKKYYWTIKLFKKDYALYRKSVKLVKPQVWETVKNKKMCELSDLEKFKIVALVGGSNGQQNNGMYYDGRTNSYEESIANTNADVKEQWKLLKLFYQRKAYGVCYWMSRGSRVLMDQLGIESWFAQDWDKLYHVWVIFKAKGDDNQYHWMMCDNGGVMEPPMQGHDYYSFTKAQIPGYPY